MRHVLIFSIALGIACVSAAEGFASHPPMRPLPTAPDRPPATGDAYYVHPTEGDDTSPGTENTPWLTVTHAASRLSPGDTLYLRGGTYYENVTVRATGTEEDPITIRSYPGELAVIDAGYREFFENPRKAWEPIDEGAEGEYRSTGMYVHLPDPADPRWPVYGSGVYSEQVKVLGNFGDSMVPLHGYRFANDLRSTNELWRLVSTNADDGEEGMGIYCGPGVWFNPETQRIHCRLAHTRLAVWGENNYRGQTDPRRLPLVISGTQPALSIEGAEYVRFQDLVFRGTRSRTVTIADSEDITLDHVTVYGGAPAFYVEHTEGLTLRHSALRGVSTPWSSRSSEKYRGISTYLFVADGSLPQNRDFELAYSEFTDCHDGLIIGTINELDFHHNRVDNFNDDGLYMTVEGLPGRNIRIHQNYISRCLTTFSYGGEGKGQEDTECCVYRNLIDLRRPVPYAMPTTYDQAALTSYGRVCGDHGGPIWKPMYFYHNTVITVDPAFRGYYGLGLGGHMQGTVRRLFNNIFVQCRGLPGLHFDGQTDLVADANLHWSIEDGPSYEGNFFETFRVSKPVIESKEHYAPGVGWYDMFGDPRLAALDCHWTNAVNPELRSGSLAVDAGLPIPKDWPDPLRASDKGKPDIGMMPLGAAVPRVGIDGRIALGPQAAKP